MQTQAAEAAQSPGRDTACSAWCFLAATTQLWQELEALPCLSAGCCPRVYGVMEHCSPFQVTLVITSWLWFFNCSLALSLHSESVMWYPCSPFPVHSFEFCFETQGRIVGMSCAGLGAGLHYPRGSLPAQDIQWLFFYHNISILSSLALLLLYPQIIFLSGRR